MRSWNVERWLELNVWESEDGASLRELCGCEYFWDGPLCWLDATTLAVWGEGEDADTLLPAVRLFNVASGRSSGWFPGPEVAPHQVWPPGAGSTGWLVYDRLLFAISPERGTGVWDCRSGERLLHEPGFAPQRYHRAAAQFLTLGDDGSVILSRLVGAVQAAAPTPPAA